MQSLANPTRFVRLSTRLVPWLAAATPLLLGSGLYLALFASPPDYQQGETVRIMFVHVPSAWLAMVGLRLLAAACGARCWSGAIRWPALMARAPRPVGACFTARLPAHRLAVGPADVGHLLGVGRAAHLDAAAVLPLSRPHRAGAAPTTTRPRRPRRRHPGAGRRHQPADHQVLGRLVEHPAPAGLGAAAGRPVDPSRHPVAAAGDGGFVLLLLLFILLVLRAHRDRDRPPRRLAEAG